jgi:hypothetical protein
LVRNSLPQLDDGTCKNTCKEVLDAGLSVGDGEYSLCTPGGQFTRKAFCYMSYDGGGWTAIARAKNTAGMNPPSIESNMYDNWQQWRGHSWRAGESYYLSLDDFATLSQNAATMVHMNRGAAGNVETTTTFTNPRYNAVGNTFSSDGCTGVKCTSRYSWVRFPPNFDGPGNPTSCSGNGGIYNYHNFAGCASDSGLFAWKGDGANAQPQQLGEYTEHADETIFLIREN